MNLIRTRLKRIIMASTLSRDTGEMMHQHIRT
jgi:hypothetical protein